MDFPKWSVRWQRKRLPFKEKFLGLDGHRVGRNGDVWMADGSDNQLLHFPVVE